VAIGNITINLMHAQIVRNAHFIQYTVICWMLEMNSSSSGRPQENLFSLHNKSLCILFWKTLAGTLFSKLKRTSNTHKCMSHSIAFPPFQFCSDYTTHLILMSIKYSTAEVHNYDRWLPNKPSSFLNNSKCCIKVTSFSLDKYHHMFLTYYFTHGGSKVQSLYLSSMDDYVDKYTG